ncbi:E3 ubiquitin-protein ligase HECW2 [Lamellibrachia satsuma]|nr:E3 ubiquitin-protein ligase HECW2 [Lamellibrachia satsuma]
MATATRVLHRSISSDVSGSVRASQRQLSSSSDLLPLGLQQKASSDSNLIRHFLCHRSSLTVDREEYVLGSGDKVTVSWDIQEDVSSTDWIGLFLVGETDPSKNLDYRSRGDSGTRKGQISWVLDQVDYDFTEATTKVCFRYYHGGTVDLQASSDTIVIKKGTESAQNASSPELVLADGPELASARTLYHVTISKISARCLKKGMFFNPDPYVKLSVQPGNRASLLRLSHHDQYAKTSIQTSTTNPDWTADGPEQFLEHRSDVVLSVAADHQPSSSILYSLQLVDQVIRDAM